MDAFTRIALAAAALLWAAPSPRPQPPGDGFAAGPRAVRPQAPAAAADSWFGDDKFRHFAMSFAATTFTFAAARSAGVHDGAVPAALATAAAAGLGKEVYDRRTGGRFSPRDLVWDALGVLAGYALIRNAR